MVFEDLVYTGDGRDDTAETGNDVVPQSIYNMSDKANEIDYGFSNNDAFGKTS